MKAYDGLRPWPARVLVLTVAAAAITATLPAGAAAADDRQAAREARRAEIGARRAEQRGRIEARNAERRSERNEQGQACDRIANWLADTRSMPPEVLARRFGGGQPGATSAALQLPYESWLLQDARFAPAFGKRYDEVPVDERASLQRAGNNCKSPRNERGQAIADNMLFFRAFDGRYFPRYVQGVVKIREAHAQIDAALRDLQGLKADEDGGRRFREHAARRGELGGFVADERRTAYQQAFRDGYQRAMLPLHTQRMRQAMAGAQGYDGLAALVALQAEMARDAQVGSAVAAVPPEVRTRQIALAQGLVAQERARIDALGSGVVGLERGVQWHEEYVRRYDGRYTSAVPELRTMLAYFEEQRGPLLDAAAPELTRRIAQTRDEAELRQLVAHTIPLDIDQRRASGTALMTRVAAQREELHKRSVIGNPVGAGGGAPPRTASGEPSEADMYDALNARLQGVNDEARRTAERCNNREFQKGQGDPVLAMQCLQFGVGVGVTQGAQGVLPPQFKVSRFQKIACEKAQGEAGYQCDYVAGFAGNLNLPPSLGTLVKNGEMTQARFVRQDRGWLLIPRR